jgi:molybdate transport system ATP-binding protein
MTLAVDIALRQGSFRLEASFSAPTGITALFGPSGSGKTSLLSAIAGLNRASGSISLNGKGLENLPAYRRGVGLVFQDARLFPHVNVRNNLLYAQRRAANPHDIQSIAGFFEIDDLLDRSVRNLSGGEKSRVALARALIAAPSLLLLDEPFAALDGVRRNAYIAVLRDAQKVFGFSALIVTHDIGDVCALANDVVAMNHGRIAVAGPLKETAHTPAFQALLDPRDIGVPLQPDHLIAGRASSPSALWLRADQVLLAADQPTAISARNILKCRVIALTKEPSGSCLVKLDTASGAILSRLTREAIQSLGIREDWGGWAIFKAHAF